MSTPELYQVRVTNYNEFDIIDHYDNVPYAMISGQEISLTPEAAFHILGFVPNCDLGFNGPVFKHVTKRWGWNTSEIVKNKTDKQRFENLKIHPVRMKMVEMYPEQTEPLKPRGRPQPPEAV